MEKGSTPPPLMENSIKKMFFFFIETFPYHFSASLGLMTWMLGVGGSMLQYLGQAVRGGFCFDDDLRKILNL